MFRSRPKPLTMSQLRRLARRIEKKESQETEEEFLTRELHARLVRQVLVVYVVTVLALLVAMGVLLSASLHQAIECGEVQWIPIEEPTSMIDNSLI